MKQLTMSVLISSVLASTTSFADLGPPSGQTMTPVDEYSWLHQFGSGEADTASAIATFGTNVYVVGAIPAKGDPFYGADSNGYLHRYDPWGNLTLEVPFGEPQKAVANAVFADETGVYVVGNTITEPANPHNPDILVVKYDLVGNTIWSQQFGPSGPDNASGITADSTGIYVAGSLSFAHSGFIYKYDRNGNKMWGQEFGQENGDFLDFYTTNAVSVDHTGVYITGGLPATSLDPDDGSSRFDAYVRKYDTNGNELWNRQFGSSTYDSGKGISATDNGIYVVGQTSGALPNQQNSGSSDAFVRKYDIDGTEIWTRQFGSDSEDIASSVIAKGNSIYVAGTTEGALPSKTTHGNRDAFMRAYDSNGTELTTLQFGTDKDDSINGIAKNWSGLFVAGSVSGTFPEQTSLGGAFDAFIANLKLPNCWESLENTENYCANSW